MLFEILVTGEYGCKYGTPKDFIVETISKLTNIPIAIPRKPAKYPRTIYANLVILQ